MREVEDDEVAFSPSADFLELNMICMNLILEREIYN